MRDSTSRDSSRGLEAVARQLVPLSHKPKAPSRGAPRAVDKVRSIQATLLAVQSRQKKYADHKVRDMTFQNGENILLKVSPIKGVKRSNKKGKLSPRYIGLFEVIDRVGPVAYRLALPPNLSEVHLVFHVSMLKKYHGDEDYIIKWYSIVLDKDL
ncbi:uncharacterized protein LOC125856047 [Solanum stenotomum]|uniref:uncharacterized protein LOC125856047 n=1 Tax=Solanum stenotomum TaxID=172797 RepID=UPI0020D08964|nr:uncharacterized protein LOC125856047 [Solanum stenotomum]